MAKQYTYDPRKYQGGGFTPSNSPSSYHSPLNKVDPLINVPASNDPFSYHSMPPHSSNTPYVAPGPGEPGYQGEIRQGASKWDNVKSDIRSFIKYPIKSIRTMNEIGYLPYNFDKGVEAGYISSNPLDFGVGMLNIPGAALKGVESLTKGNYGDSLLNFASIMPFAKPLKAAGFSPNAAKLLSKGTNKTLKANTTAAVYNTGGITDPEESSTPIMAPMSSDMIRNMSILYPDMTQDFSNMSFNDLQGLYKTIQQGTKNEQDRIKNFQQFFLDKGKSYVEEDVDYRGQPNYSVSGNTITRNRESSNNTHLPPAQYYTELYNNMAPSTLKWVSNHGNSCHYYGTCSQQAAGSTTPLTGTGTQIQQSDGGGAMLTPGEANPIMTGNSVFNMPVNYEAMGYELMPSGTTDFLPGDMIRKGFSPNAQQGQQHSIIASGYNDAQGDPLLFDNSGGSAYKGMQLGEGYKPGDYFNYDPENPDANAAEGANPMRVLRYVGDMPAYQGIQNYMQNYMQTLYPEQYDQFYNPPPPIGFNETMQEGAVAQDKTRVNMPNINKLNLPTINNSDINLEELISGMKNGGKVPSYKAGGLLNFQDNYFNSQNRYNRLEDRASKYNIDLLQTDGTAKTNQQLASDTRNARNAAFAGSGVGQAAGAFSSVAPQISGMILSGGTPGDYDPARAKAAGAVSGVGTGLQLGMNFGPIGAAVGALVGGIGGALFGGAKADKAENDRKENKENMLAANIASGKTQNEVRSAGILGQYDTEGVTSSYYAKYGGFMGQPDYTVEGGELMMAPNNNPPQTDNNGRVTQIGKNMFKFDGDTHDAPSGGIGVQGGNSEFASQTNQVLDSGFVFSDRLKADPNDYLKNI